MLCANPDIVVHVGDDLIWCAGAVARDYEAIGGRVIMAGKPHAPIYELAYVELGGMRPEPHPRHRRRRRHRREGANAQGLDCLFIASGMHGEALSTNGALDRAKVDAALAAEGARATYVMAALA